jgi:DNA mismatch repair protein MutS
MSIQENINPKDKLTPMLQQYLDIKSNYPDSILFFRMGDFYEMFYNDAEIASKILDIALTSRDKDANGKIPMCGIPYHSAENYLAKLISSGKKIAICEQVEDPKLAKGIVKREVVRVLSPGLQTLDGVLDAKGNNFLLSIFFDYTDKIFAISFLDISTGEFKTTEFNSEGDFLSEILRINPSEILLCEKFAKSELFLKVKQVMPDALITIKPDSWFENPAQNSNINVKDYQYGLKAAGALLAYVRETQKAEPKHINPLLRYEISEFLIIDESSRRNLELTENSVDRTRKWTLLDILDDTITAMGARLLKKWMLYPLKDRPNILKRLDAVTHFLENPIQKAKLRDRLKGIADIERLIARIFMGTANARDVLLLRQSLERFPDIKSELENNSDIRFLSEVFTGIYDLSGLKDILFKAIRDDAPLILREGRLIKDGFNSELDELISIQRDARGIIANLEKKERENTGINNLKVGYNRVFGYYFEISRGNLQKAPDHFIRKQTLVNAERFITQELKELEEKILNAEERRNSLEYEIFQGIIEEIKTSSNQITDTASKIAVLDCILSISEVSEKYHYSRPEIDDSDGIIINQGRHPVLERVLPVGEFIPNNIHIESEKARLILITGPNMGGKSTILRMTALITLMAQMGSFVPAQSVHIGLVDRIFTRVGATDYLSKGQSTFMVEMSETANILNHATSKSLVLLDEIGRGTSTFDGLSLAWAISEELLTKDKKGIMTLFATHYHELTGLAKKFKRCKNMHVGVREWEDKVMFLYALQDGAIDQSYGIHVASIAGIPERVIKRAEEILKEIEKTQAKKGSMGDLFGKLHFSQKSLPLVVEEKAEQSDNLLKDKIMSINLNNITPLQALTYLNELQGLCRGK